MKRLMSIVLSLVMVCTFLFSPILTESISAAEKYYDVTGGQLIFNTVNGSIVGYTGDPVDLIIPADINGVKVNRIGLGAFSKCKSLTSVTLPNGLTTIEDRVFWECENLTSINIPDTVTSIGNWFVIYCNKLTSITIGAENTAYTSQDGALFNKDKTVLLRFPGGKSGAYTIPNTVKTINEGAFYGSPNITNINIPNGVTSIGNEAFCNCLHLGNINLPDSLTNLGYGVFRDTNAGEISVSANNKNYTTIDGVLYNKTKTTVLAFPCARAGSYTIPEGVTSVFDSAFSSCRFLTDISIPKSVNNIGMAAFAYCGSLEKATFYGDAPSIGQYAFLLTSPNFKVLYLADKKGFTNPWNGYKTEVFAPQPSGSQYGEASSWAVFYLDLAVNMGFITERLSGKAMNTGVTREEFAELSVKFYERVTGRTAPLPEGKTFLDCNNSEILKAFALNITAGVGDGTKFEPNTILSRQQMATMITKTLKACYSGIILDTTGMPDFKDQGKFASYAVEPAKFMAKYGITVGDGKGSFDPTSTCTREQTIIFLVKVYQFIDSNNYQ